MHGGFETVTDLSDSEGHTELILPSPDKLSRLSAVPGIRYTAQWTRRECRPQVAKPVQCAGRIPFVRTNSGLVRFPACGFFFSTSRWPLASGTPLRLLLGFYLVHSTRREPWDYPSPRGSQIAFPSFLHTPSRMKFDAYKGH